MAWKPCENDYCHIKSLKERQYRYNQDMIRYKTLEELERINNTNNREVNHINMPEIQVSENTNYFILLLAYYTVMLPFIGIPYFLLNEYFPDFYGLPELFKLLWDLFIIYLPVAATILYLILVILLLPIKILNFIFGLFKR